PANGPGAEANSGNLFSGYDCCLHATHLNRLFMNRVLFYEEGKPRIFRSSGGIQFERPAIFFILQ
ncbi:MAG TPA: hypothetical protein VGF01_20070, partial [Terracidiphilus sp.]